MKKIELNETWQEHKVGLKKKIATMTNNNIRSAVNQKSDVFERLQATLGLSKAEIDNFFMDV